MRVLLIGGTSHTGKSTVARAVAERLGFTYRPTDLLARHPGRPWRTPDREVPPHVAEHYGTLGVDELIDSVLDHYARLWPRIEELITEHAEGDGPGLVLEGSALWPARVAALDAPHTEAVWLTADEEVLADRMRASARYAEASAEEQRLVDMFLARARRFQQLVRKSVDAAGLCRLDTTGRSVTDLVEEILGRRCRQGP
ncbi:AAA family ATPase [Streptomyces aquilus]|uniref:AAA family ATPase n=1 Tax=Streptomyces aquilus TaxID=2548456 RepID=UPI0036902AA5